jgi:light-regulated signal transduction histidine kinase (bacteriophytochrome)
VEDKRARQALRLEQSNEQLTRFASLAAHDLQEPLRMVSSYVQLPAERYEGRLDDKADRFIRYAVEGTAHMQALVGGLLSLSRLEKKSSPLVEIDSEEVLAKALESLAAPIREAGARVRHDDLPTVNGDFSQLVQLFQNLLSNAVKFRSARSPEVHVGAVRAGKQWRFSVRDNGIGIAPQDADKVFGILSRLHTRAEFEGTGIGLAICEKVVERHGGRLWLESQPGEGTTFFFTLPNTSVQRKEAEQDARVRSL